MLIYNTSDIICQIKSKLLVLNQNEFPIIYILDIHTPTYILTMGLDF